MNIRNLSWVMGGSLTVGLVALAACSSSTTTTDTNPDGGATSSSSSSSSSSGSSGSTGADLKAAAIACGYVDGAEYTTHEEVAAGSDSTCMAAADSTGTSSFDDSDAGASDTDAGIACTTTISGCTITTSCSGTSSGYSEESTATETISATGITGTESTKVTAPDGGVFENCNYTVTITKD